MKLETKQIISLLNPIQIGAFPKAFPMQIETDSRKSFFAPSSLFIAIDGPNFNGNRFCKDAFIKGIKYFLVSDEKAVPDGANALVVPNTLLALQLIAKAYRELFHIPVIGVTGSNGKTIVKDWLADICNGSYSVFKSPKSYNSQVGVALSILRMKDYHNLAIIEAGISTTEEMEQLARMIQPTIGVFTHLGSAHEAGFVSKKEKLQEKWKLFKNSSKVFVQDKLVGDFLNDKEKVEFVDLELANNYSHEFTGDTSKKNLATAIQVAQKIGVNEDAIKERVAQLMSLNMRLEQLQGINGCELINDGYSLDMDSLQIALNFMKRQSSMENRTVILTDFDSKIQKEEDYKEMIHLLKTEGVNRFIGIGSELEKYASLCHPLQTKFYRSTQAFLDSFKADDFRKEEILIKGARKFRLEKVVQVLQEKVHSTFVEINMNKLSSNIDYFRSKLANEVKLMAMVKAASYGSGTHQIANLLEYKKMDYLCVAYPDEGVELRKAGLSIPIMVLNTDKGSIKTCLDNLLEPVVYSIKFLKEIILVVGDNKCKVHLELDTGMKRLGIEPSQMEEAMQCINRNSSMELVSVFSHFAGADENDMDGFSKEQINKFDTVTKNLPPTILRHLCNTSGIIRFPEAHFDLVRLGIGMYGVNPTKVNTPLECALSLKTVISQIRDIKKGESIGYSRNYLSNQDLRIAVLPIGYADGVRRELSNKGKVYIHGKTSPIVGNVCMDMCMVDVTDIECKEGDEVVFFENNAQLASLALDMNTVPYEVLTGISSRVKRVFVEE